MFKIRCSAIYRLMGGNIGASEAQLKNIATMEARTQPMTDNQKKKYDADIFKRDNPEPTQGMKTYCKEWLKSKIYKRTKEVTTKYMEKGHFCEEIAIDFLNKRLLTEYVKNDDMFENDFMTGTPDIDADCIIDIKNSWDFSTFPLLEEENPKKEYDYQVMGYQKLTGKTDKPGKVAYLLMDAPQHIIQQEAARRAYREGGSWEDYFSHYHKQLTYGEIDPKYRYKTFDVEYNSDVIEELEHRIEMCRKYIEEISKEK